MYLMSIGRYILNTHHHKSPRIDKVQWELLALFSSVRSLPISGISLFSKQKRPMAYKNVRNRIHQLLKLNLIQKDRTGYRNATYYHLTNEGIYSIYLNFPQFDWRINLYISGSIFRYYKGAGIFKDLVYPYIAYDTLRKLKNIHFFFELFDYLHQCCVVIERYRRFYHTKASSKPLEVTLEFPISELVFSFIFRLIGLNRIKFFDEDEMKVIRKDKTFMEIAERVYNQYYLSYDNFKKLSNR